MAIIVQEMRGRVGRVRLSDCGTAIEWDMLIGDDPFPELIISKYTHETERVLRHACDNETEVSVVAADMGEQIAVVDGRYCLSYEHHAKTEPVPC